MGDDKKHYQKPGVEQEPDQAICSMAYELEQPWDLPFNTTLPDTILTAAAIVFLVLLLLAAIAIVFLAAIAATTMKIAGVLLSRAKNIMSDLALALVKPKE